MNDVQPRGAEPPAQEATPRTPGAILRAERERQGRTLDDIARTTRLRVGYLEALEADRYDRIPGGMAYVRGFLRLYATAIQLDPVPLLAQLPPAVPVAVRSVPGGGGQGARPRGRGGAARRRPWWEPDPLLLAMEPRRRMRSVAGLAALVVVVALTASWILARVVRSTDGLVVPAPAASGPATPGPGALGPGAPVQEAPAPAVSSDTAPVPAGPDGTLPDGTPPAVTSPAVTPPAVTPPGGVSAAGAAAAGTPAVVAPPAGFPPAEVAAGAPEPAPEPAPPAPPAPAEAATAPAPPSEGIPAAVPTGDTGPMVGGVTLDVLARDRCWVEVHADGRLIFTRTMAAGEQLRWQASRLLTVRFGRAEAVHLRLNGVPLAPIGRGVVTRSFAPETAASQP